MLAELAQGIAIFAHGFARNFQLGLERDRPRRFRCRLIARKIKQHEHGDGREKSVMRIGPALPGAKFPAVTISVTWMTPAPMRKAAAASEAATRASKP